MIRQLSRPSTAHCTLGHYIGMLISEPKQPTCKALAQIQHKNYAQKYQALGKTVHEVG